MTTNEIWKDIPGYEGMYQVSDLGRVRGVDRIDGNGHLRKGKILVPTDNGTGYLQLSLSKDAKCRKFTVHRLVMLAFADLRPEGCNINHKDGDKHNNNLRNLEYVLFQDNSRHAVKKLGKMFGVKGEKHPSAKLTQSEVLEIRRLYAAGGVGYPRLARMFGVTKTTIEALIKKRTWSHIKEDTP